MSRTCTCSWVPSPTVTVSLLCGSGFRPPSSWSVLRRPFLRPYPKNHTLNSTAVFPAAGPLPATVALGNAWRRASCIDSNRRLRQVLPRCLTRTGEPCGMGGTRETKPVARGAWWQYAARRRGGVAGRGSARGGGGRWRQRSGDRRHIKDRGARNPVSGGRGRTRRGCGKRRRCSAAPEEAGPTEPASDGSEPGEVTRVWGPAPQAQASTPESGLEVVRTNPEIPGTEPTGQAATPKAGPLQEPAGPPNAAPVAEQGPG